MTFYKRMLDPSFWGSTTYVEADTLGEAILWLGMITHADDTGRMKDIPRVLWSALFTVRENNKITIEDVMGWLDTLEANGNIIRYEVDGNKYIQLANWGTYQLLTRPRKSHIPPPPNEGKGREVKGREEKGVNMQGSEPLPASPLPQVELAALSLCIEIIQGKKRKPTKAEITAWKRIRKGWSIEQIHDCIRWAVKDDFWAQNVKGFAPLGRAKVSGDAIKFEKVWGAYQRSPALEAQHHTEAVKEHTAERKRKPVVDDEQRKRNIDAMQQKMKDKPIGGDGL